MFGNKANKIQKCISKKTAAPVIKLLKDKDVTVVMQAIEALGKIPGDESYNELVSLLRSPAAEVRTAAITALGELGDPKGRAHIAHMEKTEKDAVVLEAANKALARLHGQD